MTVHALKPVFKNRDGYKTWISIWREIYSRHTEQVRKLKVKVKNKFRDNDLSYKEDLKELNYQKIIGRKMMGILAEAKERMKMIVELKKSIDDQYKEFPIHIENAKNIEFHFNKKSLEFPDIVPFWVLKAKGRSFYIHHLDCATPWTTRENPDHPSTKGSIRIKKGNISIDSNGHATIT